MSVELRLAIAKDLRAIKVMFRDLRTEAENHADDPDIPGGEAMFLLGPTADVEAWGYMKMSILMGRLDPEAAEGMRKGELEPPLSFLASWTDIVREERDQPTDLRATVDREADYLLNSIDWMLSLDEYDEPRFLQVDDFANGLKDIRRGMENVLRDGERSELARVTCVNDECAEKPRLVKVYADDAVNDHHKCPACRQPYDFDEFVRAAKIHAFSETADDAWVTVADAAYSIGRPANTIRTWIKNWKVSTQRAPGVPTTIYVSWPEVRDINAEARRVEARRKARRIA